VGKIHFQTVHSAVPGGQNPFSSSAFRCIPEHFVHQAQLNAHVRPFETKMAGGHENDELGTLITNAIPT
jgi:hypothetical protein